MNRDPVKKCCDCFVSLFCKLLVAGFIIAGTKEILAPLSRRSFVTCGCLQMCWVDYFFLICSVLLLWTHGCPKLSFVIIIFISTHCLSLQFPQLQGCSNICVMATRIGSRQNVACLGVCVLQLLVYELSSTLDYGTAFTQVWFISYDVIHASV